MVSNADLIELIKCKYLANAEYLKSVLNDKNIYVEINFDDHSILINKSDFKAAKEVICKENLDETETIVQENFMEGLDEWNNNNVDPGHYLGGNIPYFYRTGSNQMTFSVVLFISLIFQIGFLFLMDVTLWNIIFIVITLIAAISFMISGFNYRDELKAKKSS